MSRYLFGGTADAFAVATAADGTLKIAGGATVKAYLSEGASSHVTDLLAADGVTPLPQGDVTLDAKGTWRFYGPDNVRVLWLGVGTDRVKLVPTNLTEQVAGIDTRVGALEAAPPGGGVTVHGNLSSLDEDDHPQYLNETRGDARYYTQAQVDSALGDKVNDDDARLSDARTPLSHSHPEITDGFVWRAAFNPAADPEYAEGDAVSHEGSSWRRNGTAAGGGSTTPATVRGVHSPVDTATALTTAGFSVAPQAGDTVLLITHQVLSVAGGTSPTAGSGSWTRRINASTPGTGDFDGTHLAFEVWSRVWTGGEPAAFAFDDSNALGLGGQWMIAIAGGGTPVWGTASVAGAAGAGLSAPALAGVDEGLLLAIMGVVDPFSESTYLSTPGGMSVLSSASFDYGGAFSAFSEALTADASTGVRSSTAGEATGATAGALVMFPPAVSGGGLSEPSLVSVHWDPLALKGDQGDPGDPGDPGGEGGAGTIAPTYSTGTLAESATTFDELSLWDLTNDGEHSAIEIFVQGRTRITPGVGWTPSNNTRITVSFTQDLAGGHTVVFSGVVHPSPRVLEVDKGAGRTTVVVFEAVQQSVNSATSQWRVTSLETPTAPRYFSVETIQSAPLLVHPDADAASVATVRAAMQNMPSAILPALAGKGLRVEAGLTDIRTAPGSAASASTPTGQYTQFPRQRGGTRKAVAAVTTGPALLRNLVTAHELGHAIDFGWFNSGEILNEVSLAGVASTESCSSISDHGEWQALYTRLLNTAGTPSSYAKTNAVEFLGELLMARYGSNAAFSSDKGATSGYNWLRDAVFGVANMAETPGGLYYDVKQFLIQVQIAGNAATRLPAGAIGW